MTETRNEELRRALSMMMSLIETGAGTDDHGASLSDQLRSIDRLKEELDPVLPSMLKHYLEKRSYAKALDFLEGRDNTVTPNC